MVHRHDFSHACIATDNVFPCLTHRQKMHSDDRRTGEFTIAVNNKGSLRILKERSPKLTQLGQIGRLQSEGLRGGRRGIKKLPITQSLEDRDEGNKTTNRTLN